MSAEFAIDPAEVRTWKRYPEYKDSGVEWLGKVPAGWEVKRFKFIARVRLSSVDKKSKEGEKGVMLCNYTDVYYNDRINKDLEFMKATASPEEIASFTLRQGDLLITKDSEDWKDIAVPAHVDEDLDDVLCGYHLAQIRPDQKAADSRYLFWSFNAHRVNHQFQIAANGITRYGVGKYWIDNSSFLVPPLPEQHAIAAFLDRETARLDALIGKKQRFIELLEEKRQALITRAVTKGLDPDVEMKDSGVEWLGEVPAGWAISRLGLISESLQTGPFGSQLHASEYIEDGIPVINPSNIQDGTIVPDPKCTVGDNTLKRLIRHRLTTGDIIFARRGDMGRCACIARETEGWLCGTGSIRIRLNESAHPEFVMTFLSTQGVKDYLLTESVGSTMDNLNTSILSRIPVVLPPLAEQKAIMKRIIFGVGQIDEILSSVSETVSKLHEYRTSLISAAVTGKIDVRGEVPAAPCPSPPFTPCRRPDQ
ncbi:MAG: restriction endonuclease subunit S [Methanomicrobiales archaeon]|nr:restriction endonuclease subunit S [Methanomicrobiales archaeon]